MSQELAYLHFDEVRELALKICKSCDGEQIPAIQAAAIAAFVVVGGAIEDIPHEEVVPRLQLMIRQGMEKIGAVSEEVRNMSIEEVQAAIMPVQGKPS